MSGTLTWHKSENATKTGTAIGDLFTDLKNMFDAKSGDSDFKWQVSGSNIGSTPYYIMLKRKSGAVGRILLVAWSSSPAGNNAAILQQAPSTNAIFMAYFPAGNADTASNLTASSGTIAGDDTGAVKCSAGNAISTVYTTSFQCSWFDCEDGAIIMYQNPAGSTQYWQGAGDLVVDASDVAYPCTIGVPSNASNFSTTSGWFSWNGPSSTINAGQASSGVIRTNYGGTDRLFFPAFIMNTWPAQTLGGGNEILRDAGTSKAYFAPMILVGRTVGVGFPLKLRQIAVGPATSTAFAVYSESGPVVVAMQPNSYTLGQTGSCWLTNFKL